MLLRRLRIGVFISPAISNPCICKAAAPPTSEGTGEAKLAKLAEALPDRARGVAADSGFTPPIADARGLSSLEAVGVTKEVEGRGAVPRDASFVDAEELTLACMLVEPAVLAAGARSLPGAFSRACLPS